MLRLTPKFDEIMPPKFPARIAGVNFLLNLYDSAKRGTLTPAKAAENPTA